MRIPVATVVLIVADGMTVALADHLNASGRDVVTVREAGMRGLTSRQTPGTSSSWASALLLRGCLRHQHTSADRES